MVPAEKAYQQFLTWLQTGKPFTFVRFNDGEMGAVTGRAKTIARRDQKVTKGLTTSLEMALKYRHPNYWIGGPCRTCYPALRRAFDKRTEDCPRTAPATVFCNGGRWPRFLRDSFAALKDKSVFCFQGEDQRMPELMELIGVSEHDELTLPTQNSFKSYDYAMKYLLMYAESFDIFLFTCGPLGRILAREGCGHDPDRTWLDLGSTYDPLTRQVWHRCHTGELPKCPECNRT